MGDVTWRDHVSFTPTDHIPRSICGQRRPVRMSNAQRLSERLPIWKRMLSSAGAFFVLVVWDEREGIRLEIGGESHGEAAGRPDRVAGEKAAEVNHVKDVGKVLPIDLKSHLHTI